MAYSYIATCSYSMFVFILIAIGQSDVIPTNNHTVVVIDTKVWQFLYSLISITLCIVL